MNRSRRIKNLVSTLKKDKSSANLDCVFITTLPNLVYFFHYPGRSFERFCCGLISLDNYETSLVTPKLDEPKAKIAFSDNFYTWTDAEEYKGAFSRALESIQIKGSSPKFGCENGISLGTMNSVKKVKNAATFASVSEIIEGQRMIKDEEEMTATRAVAKKLSNAYGFLPGILQAGKREDEVAFEMRKILREKGVAQVDFCAIQSGSNSAIPHLETTEKKIMRGDMIVVDISCVDESSYFADFTRTFAVGTPTKEQLKVYETVKEAQAMGLASSKSGTRAEVVDRSTRKVIERAGYGKYFTHRTGHGLGLEVHEQPWIKQGNSLPLDIGMIFTIEPGVYLEGKFGVRIEDNVMITTHGTENITKLDHDLIRI